MCSPGTKWTPALPPSWHPTNSNSAASQPRHHSEGAVYFGLRDYRLKISCSTVLAILLLCAPADARAQNVDFIAAQDAVSRQCFNPKIIRPGFVQEQRECDYQAVDDLHEKITNAIGVFSDSSRANISVLGGTSWSYTETDLSRHPAGFLLRSKTSEWHYIYAESTGLLPVALRVYRRGDPFYKTPGTEAVAIARQSMESHLRIILARNPDGTVTGASPATRLTGRSILGTQEYGQTVSDCRALEFEIQNDVSARAFTSVGRRNCLANVVPWEDDARCSFGSVRCTAETKCEGDQEPPLDDLDASCCVKCCDPERSPWTSYNKNATCAWVSMGADQLKSNNTLQDILNGKNYWADQMEGTGQGLQSIIINIRTKEGRNDPGADEAERQLFSFTEVSADLGDRMATDIEESVWSRPTPIDLTLVVAAQLAGAMAIDSGRLLNFVLVCGRKILPKEDPTARSYRYSLLFLVFLVSFVSTIPGLLTTAVIIYLEVAHANLRWVPKTSGWFFTDLYPETDGERIWHVRRVMASSLGTTEHRIRPLYIVLPIVMMILEFAAEAAITMKVYIGTLARLRDQQSQLYKEVL